MGINRLLSSDEKQNRATKYGFHWHRRSLILFAYTRACVCVLCARARNSTHPHWPNEKYLWLAMGRASLILIHSASNAPHMHTGVRALSHRDDRHEKLLIFIFTYIVHVKVNTKWHFFFSPHLPSCRSANAFSHRLHIVVFIIQAGEWCMRARARSPHQTVRKGDEDKSLEVRIQHVCQ